MDGIEVIGMLGAEVTPIERKNLMRRAAVDTGMGDLSKMETVTGLAL